MQETPPPRSGQKFQLFKWRLAKDFIALIPKRWRTLTDDRQILEQVIFKELFVSRQYGKILFVGCDSYTRWYPLLFEWAGDLTFATVEPEARKKKYGSRRHHTIGRFQDLQEIPSFRHFYDLVIFNGVFGFGTDMPEDKVRIFETSACLLKPGGVFLIGYNDMEGNYRFDLNLPQENGFEAFPIPGLHVSDFLTQEQNHHRFVCFRRKNEKEI